MKTFANTDKIKLVRFTMGNRKGRYCLQIDRNNQWGFSLIAEDGFESPGGFDFGNSAFVVSDRKWPRWAQSIVSDPYLMD